MQIANVDKFDSSVVSTWQEKAPLDRTVREPFFWLRSASCFAKKEPAGANPGRRQMVQD